MSNPPSDEAAARGAEPESTRVDAAILGLDPGTNPFVAAVRATRMPMIITNPRQPDNPVVFANDAFCRLTGYGREEILGRNCRFLQGPGSDPAVVGRIRAAVAGERSIETDVRNYRKNGEAFWNRLLLAPVRDEGGALAYFFASQVDVTLERERLAGLETQNAALLAQLGERLRLQEDSEARLRFATQAGRLGIWELDLRTDELIASRICRENFGRDPALPFTYADLRAAIHPDDRAGMLAAVAASIEAGSDYGIEYRVLRPDGAVGWVEVRAQVLRAPDGEPLRMAGTSRDVTARKRAEARSQALLDLDNAFRAGETPADLAYAAAEVLGRTLGVSRAGYGTVDPQAETITIERDWSAPGIRSLAGTLHFRTYGSYIEDLKRGDTVVFADADEDPRTAATAPALKAISAQAVVNMPVSEQGGLVALLYLNNATARDWPADDLAFIREVATRTRTTVERRRAELGMRELAATLESQVAARTAELMEAEAALRQSQKMEAVGQLTGGIAHDFNNLLTGITGTLELVRNRAAQGRIGEAERYITAALAAAGRAASLTHRLLAFSRRQSLDPKPTDANRLVAGMEDLIRRTVGPAIAVEVAGAPDLWSTLVDAGQLENALLNLCINARDAMPDGGSLVIRTANVVLDGREARDRELQPGPYVLLSVADTGSGMPPDVIAKAFDPFFTTKPIGQGTGLGLSMIYGFAQQSGGQARIASEVGRGTTVGLYLPRHAAAVPRGEAEAGAGEARRANPGQTVLVVDDEPTVRMLVADVLEELGYAALRASDGAEAVTVLQSKARVDLLITDVGLPNGLNGRQVSEAARQMRPGLKVLFITGYAETAGFDPAELPPGTQVLRKPFSTGTLAARIGDLLA